MAAAQPVVFQTQPPLNQMTAAQPVVFQTTPPPDQTIGAEPRIFSPPIAQIVGEVLVALQMPPLDQPTRNQTMAFLTSPFPANTSFPSTIPHYQQVTPNNLHTQSSPIFPTLMLTLPFPHQAFYGLNPSHHSPYNNTIMYPYTMTPQYNSQGAIPIPNQDCLSHNVTSPFAKELLEYKIPNTTKLSHLKT